MKRNAIGGKRHELNDERHVGLVFDSANTTLETMGVCCRAKEQTAVIRLVRHYLIHGLLLGVRNVVRGR